MPLVVTAAQQIASWIPLRIDVQKQNALLLWTQLQIIAGEFGVRALGACIRDARPGFNPLKYKWIP